MGCVFGRQASGRKPVERQEWRRDEEKGEHRAIKAEIATGATREDGCRREDGGEERNVRSSRRSSRPRNIPKHIYGEQVAAGWPSWLSEVAGEAINGWTPRRADTFQKLDKVTSSLFINDFISSIQSSSF